MPGFTTNGDAAEISFPAPSDVPVKSDDLVSRAVGGETILIPIRSSKSELDDIFTLNDVGSRTWDLIDGTSSVAEIAGVIAAEYEVAEQTALADTRQLIGDFAAAAMVTLYGAAK